MIVQIVRFKSRLAETEVLRTYRARADRYRALPGLLQKYYLRYPATGEHGAVYVWESPDAVARFRDSELARTIADAYKVDGTPVIETADVAMTLHEEAVTAASASRRTESRDEAAE